jgi:hypothetical protein
MGTKLIELFANRVVERRNMINDYLREGELALRVLGGVLNLSFCADFELLPWFELFLALSYHFAWLWHFSCHVLVLRFYFF